MPFFDFYKDLQFKFDIDVPIVVPISRGKDSQATLMLALNTRNKIYPVFNDTGFEHPLTYQHLLYLEKTFGLRTAESSQRKHKYAGLVPNDLFDMEDLFPNRYNKKLRSKIIIRLPIITWTRQWVFRYLKEQNINYNPLYDEGTNDRVGCYPCLLANSTVQRKTFNIEFGQTQLEKIKQLEIELNQKYEMFDTDKNECQLCKI